METGSATVEQVVVIRVEPGGLTMEGLADFLVSHLKGELSSLVKAEFDKREDSKIRRIVTFSAAARHLGISRETLRKRRASGLFYPASKKSWTTQELDDYLVAFEAGQAESFVTKWVESSGTFRGDE